MIKNFLIGVLIMSFCLTSLKSEDDEVNKSRARFGLWYNYGLNQYQVKELQLPTVSSCCEKFSVAYGLGQSMGILLELPLNDNIFWGLRAGYYSKYAKFEEKYNSIFDYNATDTMLTVNQNLAAFISNISLESYISAELFKGFYLSFGYRFGYFIEKNYDYHYESLPFIDGGFEQNENSESLFEDLSDYDASLIFGLNYEIPINDSRTFFLVPEIIYEKGVKNIYKNGDWKISTLRAGFSVKISPELSRRMIREIYLYDTLIVYKQDINEEYLKPGFSTIREYESKENKITYKVSEILRIDTLFKPSNLNSNTDLFTDMSVYGKMAWGDVQTVNSVLAKVQMTKEIYPLLPYVFFEKSSFELLPHYKDNTFDLTSYYPNPVKYHHNILNIIADRMLKNPHCKIELKGFVDETTEGRNCELAYQRAESVKKYLVKNCNISEDRIEILKDEVGCFPQNLTKALTEERYEENRIVEISSSNTKILDPISGDWYQKPIVITPNIIYFDVSGSSLERIGQWNFKLYQDKLSLMDLKDKSKDNIFEHNITEEEAYFLNSEQSLTAEYIAYNDIGEFSSVKKDIKVFIDTLVTEIESLNLVLFAVADSRLTESIENQIQAFVSHLDKNDKLYVYGYTDSLGNEELNKELAKSRAYQIAMYINKVNPDVKIETVEGLGTRKYAPGISTYNSPEERFLSRTVEIQIRRTRK